MLYSARLSTRERTLTWRNHLTEVVSPDAFRWFSSTRPFTIRPALGPDTCKVLGSAREWCIEMPSRRPSRPRGWIHCLGPCTTRKRAYRLPNNTSSFSTSRGRTGDRHWPRRNCTCVSGFFGPIDRGLTKQRQAMGKHPDLGHSHPAHGV